MEEVESQHELEYPHREAAFFYGLYLRGHSPENLRRDIEVPADVLAKLESSCAAAAKEPAYAEAMKKQATDVRYMGRKQYADWLKGNDDLNKTLAKDLGLLKR